MAETVTPPAPSPTPEPAPVTATTQPTTPAPEPAPIPYGRFKDVNDKLQTTTEKLAEYERQEAQRKKDADIAAGNHQKIIDELTPQAERGKKLEATVKTIVESELAQIPEARRGLVPASLSPEDQLDYIAKNRAFLMDEGTGKKTTANKPVTPAGGSAAGDNKRIFTQAEISDSKFYAEHRDEILLAQKEGRIQG